ncbi:MAG TPA: redoxin domain-containing protein [Gaiellaceae bacterium]|nr:redoxin domain-containing protein [Gaiellaceae bacterium]
MGDTMPDARVWRSTTEAVTLRGLADESPYLLLSYLFDWSSTCTNELSELHERRRELAEAGVTPYGLSRDSPFSHVAWTQALDIEVGLLSDWNGEAVAALDLLHEFRGLRDVARRAAFLVDGTGIIRGAWRYEPSEVSDFDALVSAARSLS